MCSCSMRITDLITSVLSKRPELLFSFPSGAMRLDGSAVPSENNYPFRCRILWLELNFAQV